MGFRRPKAGRREEERRPEGRRARSAQNRPQPLANSKQRSRDRAKFRFLKNQLLTGGGAEIPFPGVRKSTVSAVSAFLESYCTFLETGLTSLPGSIFPKNCKTFLTICHEVPGVRK